MNISYPELAQRVRALTDGDLHATCGKVGGYRDYFTDEQLAELDGLVENTLEPAYGYTTRQP